MESSGDLCLNCRGVVPREAIERLVRRGELRFTMLMDGHGHVVIQSRVFCSAACEVDYALKQLPMSTGGDVVIQAGDGGASGQGGAVIVKGGVSSWTK